MCGTLTLKDSILDHRDIINNIKIPKTIIKYLYISLISTYSAKIFGGTLQ